MEIKGSEVVTGWVKVQDDVWKVTLPNALFADFNPYSDVIRGDWFEPKGRTHHTGAVYLNGDWLTEAVTRDEVMLPAGTSPAWLEQAGGQYLLNVAWLRLGEGTQGAKRIPATRFCGETGHAKLRLCSEGGECIGFIEHGHWVRYEQVDFGSRTEQMEIRAASAVRRRDHRDPTGRAGRGTAGNVSGRQHGRLAVVVVFQDEDQARERDQDALPGVQGSEEHLR